MKDLRENLEWAQEKHIDIGHFNVSDSEGFKAVVETAQELGVPVIIGVSEGERDFIGLDEVIALVKTARNRNLPVFINADHTYSLEKAKIAIEAGGGAILIDATDQTEEKRVQLTTDTADYAGQKNS